jgi:hypothetical protein
VQPGQTGKIPLKLTTKGHGGPLKKVVNVATNVPDLTAPVALTIQGEIWEPVAFTPRIVTFGQLTAEAARQPSLPQQVIVTNNLDESVEIKDVHCTSPLYQVETKTLEPGKKYELTITIVGPLKAGSNSGLIEFSTSAAEVPTLRIPVQAVVTADVDISPPQMALPQTIAADVDSQFIIRNHTQTPLDITDLTASNPGLQVELQEGPDALSHVLHLTVAAGAELSPGGEKITFKTGVLSQPEVTIPILVKRGPATRPSPPVPSRPAGP